MIAKHTSDAISSSAASTVSSSFVASRPATRKPPELTSRCYASQQQGSGSKLSTRPRLGVQSRSAVESAMLMLHSGRPYGTDSSRQHDSTYRYSATDLTDGAPACSNSSRDGSNFP